MSPVEPPLDRPLRRAGATESDETPSLELVYSGMVSTKIHSGYFPPHLERYNAVIALRRHKGTESLISAPPSAAKIFWCFLTFRRLQQQFKDFAFKRGRNFPKRIHSEINLFAFKLRDGNTLKTNLKGKALL